MSAFTVPIIDGLLDIGSKIIDKVFPDKVAQEAERAKAQLALLELQQSGSLKEMQVQLSAIIAEAQSNDPWTSRARPSFLYVMYIMILSAIPMGIAYAFQPEIADKVAIGMGKWLAALPEELYWLFGAGYLGYTGFRGFEKVRGAKK